jgi:branched-chain amino acid aminotransferase
MEQTTIDTVAANGMRDAYIRLVVTRGVGDLGIDPDKCVIPTIFIIVSTISLYPPKFYEEGIPLITASTRRIPLECLDPRIKSCNYLNNILAKIEAKRAGVPEAIMLNLNGRVAECTADNIFITKNGTLLTPRLTEGALPGVTRESVLELAVEAGLKAEETILGLHDLYNSHECFLTGTGAEIVPVVQIDGRQVGDGKPGPRTKMLRERFQAMRVRVGHKVDYEAATVTAAD